MCFGGVFLDLVNADGHFLDRGGHRRSGIALLAGALGPMVALNPGDHVRADVGGLGDASFTYTKA